MAKKPSKPRNVASLSLIERRGAGAGFHRSRPRDEARIPRNAKFRLNHQISEEE